MSRTGAAPSVIVETSRVRIREKCMEDAHNDFLWRRNPELAALDGAKPISLSFEEFAAQLERDLLTPDPSRRTYALEAPEGTHIGNIMYYNGDSIGGSAEFGIVVADPRYRGNGIGTAATVAFLRWLWQARPFRLIYLHTLEWNDPARRCFAAAGFDDVARVLRKQQWFIRMEARREWWLMWDMEGRFSFHR